MRRTRRGFSGFVQVSALAGVLAVASGSAPSMAQDAGAGLVQRLQALEGELSALRQKVATLEERRFEGGDLLIHKDQFPELLDGARPCGDFRGIVNRRVTFSKPFVRTPKVALGISQFDVGRRGQDTWHRLHLDTIDVNKEGFSYRFITHCDTLIGSAKGSWFAYLED